MQPAWLVIKSFTDAYTSEAAVKGKRCRRWIGSRLEGRLWQAAGELEMLASIAGAIYAKIITGKDAGAIGGKSDRVRLGYMALQRRNWPASDHVLYPHRLVRRARDDAEKDLYFMIALQINKE
jgi:hypothetical protein